jgi:hypothetical protein
VSDQDFNFRPQPERRAPKSFEPPPWEQAQFDELERRKAEELARSEKAAAEARQAEAAAALPDDGSAEDVITVAAVVRAPSAEEKAVPRAASGDDRLADAGVSERQVEAMLLGLRTEEPPVGRGLWKFALASAAFIVVVGLVLAIWGAVALVAARKTGATGALGGVVLITFGIGFVGVGVWVAFRTLREQGVL